MDILNSREMATLVWLFVFLIWSLRQPNVPQRLRSVFESAFVGKLKVLYILMFSYVSLLVGLLHEAGIWEPEFLQIKATLLWMFTAGIVSVFRAVEMKGQPGYLIKSAKDILSITAVLEFLVGFYTFGFFAELVIIPVLAFLAGLQVVARLNDEHKQVATLIDGIFVILGITVLSNAFYNLIVGFGAIATSETLIDFATPLLLSLLFLPFIYLLSIYVVYEGVFSRIGFRCDNDSIETYAKWRAVFSFNIGYRALDRWADHLNYTRLDSKAAVRSSIAEVKSRLAYEKQPRTIPKEEGWSPFEAKDFLTDQGLKTGHYKHLGDGEWFVSSNALAIGQRFSGNSISYDVSGNEFAAKKLKLKLYVQQPDNAEIISEFVRVAEALLSAALEGQAITNLGEIIRQGINAQVTSGGTEIAITKDIWEHSNCGQFDVTLTLFRSNSSTEISSD